MQTIIASLQASVGIAFVIVGLAHLRGNGRIGPAFDRGTQPANNRPRGSWVA
jgi:hypothetical protein